MLLLKSTILVQYSIKKKDIGRIFKTIHTYYVLETQPQGWRVERRYNDLLKLRSCLTKTFSGFIVLDYNYRYHHCLP